MTYLRSREAREAESESRDVYEKVYDAERPELFAKAAGWRVRGPGAAIRVRADSKWNVPEPELTLVINTQSEIVGWCVGNDVSSRDIEGANPLYLPQAKVYNGSCALGPGITLAEAENMGDLPIALEILRNGQHRFQRRDAHLADQARGWTSWRGYLTRELDFPHGVFLMTGTGIVPVDDFTLKPGRHGAHHDWRAHAGKLGELIYSGSTWGNDFLTQRRKGFARWQSPLRGPPPLLRALRAELHQFYKESSSSQKISNQQHATQKEHHVFRTRPHRR